MPNIEWRDYAWQCDTMFVERLGRLVPIFCSLEVTSRLGFVRMYTKSKPTGAETVEFLTELAFQHTVHHLSTDPGTEYTNADVRAWCEDNRVTLYHFDTGQMLEKSLIERFNRTIRQHINYLALGHRAAWSADDVAAIGDFYNAQYHRGIKMRPQDVTAEDMARIREDAYGRSDAYKELLNKFVPGARVRVWMGANPEWSIKEIDAYKFSHKTGPRWTDRVYAVEKAVGYKVKLQGYTRRISPRDLLLLESSATDSSSGSSAARPASREAAVTEAARRHRKEVRMMHKAGLTEVARDMAASPAVVQGSRRSPRFTTGRPKRRSRSPRR